MWPTGEIQPTDSALTLAGMRDLSTAAWVRTAAMEPQQHLRTSLDPQLVPKVSIKHSQYQASSHSIGPMPFTQLMDQMHTAQPAREAGRVGSFCFRWL